MTDLLARAGLGRLRFFLRKLRHPVRPSDLVVDIGSGGDPHPRANVLVEKFIDSSYHRTVPFRRGRTQSVVIADISAMPFRDNAFDYSICAHVLEHVEDPEAAAKEISRISESGYVETPSALHERLWPQGQHLWMVTASSAGLDFMAKPSAHGDMGLVEFFQGRWSRDKTLMRWVWAHESDFFVEHFWRNELTIHTVGQPSSWFTEEELEERTRSMGDRKKDSQRKRRLYEVLSSIRYH